MNVVIQFRISNRELYQQTTDLDSVKIAWITDRIDKVAVVGRAKRTDEDH
jgi:hypothetical protein